MLDSVDHVDPNLDMTNQNREELHVQEHAFTMSLNSQFPIGLPQLNAEGHLFFDSAKARLCTKRNSYMTSG